MSYYLTDPDDPDAPVRLSEYKGLTTGSKVRYENPAWQQPDGTYKTGGMDGPLTVTALFSWVTESGVDVTAILNDGEWEVNADNLVLDVP